MLYKVEFRGPANNFPEKLIDRMIELDTHGDIPPYSKKKGRVIGKVMKMIYFYPNIVDAKHALDAYSELAKILNKEHTVVDKSGENETYRQRYYVYLYEDKQ